MLLYSSNPIRIIKKKGDNALICILHTEQILTIPIKNIEDTFDKDDVSARRSYMKGLFWTLEQLNREDEEVKQFMKANG